MPHAKLVYLSEVPKSLPSVFPIGLGEVRSDIADLRIEYYEAVKSLHVMIVLADGIEPGPENPGAAFDDLVVGLVGHVSFELGLPIQLPSLISYDDPDGAVTVYPKPMTVNTFLTGRLPVDSDELRARLSMMVPVSSLLQEYNAAAHIDNSVQQFVALWGILACCAGSEAVADVETFLHTMGVEDEPGPKGPETRYARVRDEIAHPADREVKLADLPAKVDTFLAEFRQVVKKAVAARVFPS